ncbi:MAG: response regulator [Lachnospiraceae bacterium]|nr:response regulator [Lachnospiraceae bacterium]
MNMSTIDPEVIQYILALLNIPPYRSTDDGQAHDTLIVRQIIRFMDEMPGGFFIYHAAGDEKLIFANQAMLRIFQCETLDEFRAMTGNSFRGIVHPDDLEEVEQSIQEQIAASQYDLDYIEYRITRKDGSVRWIEDYGHFIRNRSVGDIFYVFASDATEKKNHLLNLIEAYNKERNSINQEHLRRLEVIEGLSINYDSILYADLDSDTILPYRLSSRTKRQFDERFQKRQFLWYVSDYIDTWVHPEDRGMLSRATAPEYIRKRLADGKTYYINYRVINGEKIQYLQLRIVNVSKKDHISQIVLGYRRVDEELRREMEQKQILESALENAKLAILAKNTFLSNMSHDMRTPLNAIFGFTGLAKKHLDDTEAMCSYLEKIETSSRQLLDLIDKVLEISWTETDNTHITETECSLRSILQDVHRSLSLPASEKNIAFTLDDAGLEHPDIYGDPDKLRHLFLYLADNAVTYTQTDGQVDLTVREVEKLSNDYIVYQFIFRDTGIGISESSLQRIFDPFEREKNTTFSGIHGTGLGLTIARNIAEMMQGSIDVESTLGVGSTFTATLRLRIQNQTDPVFADSNEVLQRLFDQKILLVEDNEINLEIETEMLEELGFLIDTAENGSIAVEKIRNAKPGEYALILMDIQMPVMDGRAATRAIRSLEDPELSHIPIIALTADAFESDRLKSIECGMDAHLTKPIDVPVLLETIAHTVYTHTTDL